MQPRQPELGAQHPADLQLNYIQERLTELIQKNKEFLNLLEAMPTTKNVENYDFLYFKLREAYEAFKRLLIFYSDHVLNKPTWPNFVSNFLFGRRTSFETLLSEMDWQMDVFKPANRGVHQYAPWGNLQDLRTQNEYLMRKVDFLTVTRKLQVMESLQAPAPNCALM